MTCCVIALAFAMQLIESWRRVKDWLGIVPREHAHAAGGGLGTAVAGWMEKLRHPAVRYSVAGLIAFEAVAGAAWVYGHRVHLGNEMAALVYATTGYGSGLCDGLDDGNSVAAR